MFRGEQIQLMWDDREKGAASGSGGSCNLVQEISFHITKLS